MSGMCSPLPIFLYNLYKIQHTKSTECFFIILTSVKRPCMDSSAIVAACFSLCQACAYCVPAWKTSAENCFWGHKVPNLDKSGLVAPLAGHFTA